MFSQNQPWRITLTCLFNCRSRRPGKCSLNKLLKNGCKNRFCEEHFSGSFGQFVEVPNFRMHWTSAFVFQIEISFLLEVYRSSCPEVFIKVVENFQKNLRGEGKLYWSANSTTSVFLGVFRRSSYSLERLSKTLKTTSESGKNRYYIIFMNKSS